MLIRMLASIIDATEEQVASPEFVRRVSPFVANAARKLPVSVSLGDTGVRLKKPTRRNGHFQQWLSLPGHLVDRCLQSDLHGRPVLRPLITCSAPDGVLQSEGSIWLARSGGWSVISDVDDTIKESAIGDRRKMLVNTFLRDFQAVEGMAEVYGRLARSGAGFHYVSSSPCQLLGPLSGLLADAGFPGGSMHLREFRLRNHVLQKVARIRRSGKSRVIRRLIQSQPSRRFLLIGDSGETDIDIYRKAARRYPDQVAGIFIRRLECSEFPADKMRRLRDSCPATLCADFEHPHQLDGLLARVVEQSG